MSDNGIRTRFAITFPANTAKNIQLAADYYEEKPATIIRLATKLGLQQLGSVLDAPPLDLPGGEEPVDEAAPASE